MAKPIPTASEVAAKWVKRASAATEDLVAGVKAATWKTEAIAGEDNFKTAMSNVLNKQLRKKGIEKSSDTAWQTGVETNKDRYGTGVINSESEMAQGMTPVLNDIKTAVAALPKKGPKGSAVNYDRSKQLGTKLHDAAESRKSA